ncbi:hypothetical protein KXW61_007626, partial [Aspergillus fumigatus]
MTSGKNLFLQTCGKRTWGQFEKRLASSSRPSSTVIDGMFAQSPFCAEDWKVRETLK